MAEQGESSGNLARLELNESDIPGAALSGPWENHAIAELCWWLVCRGIKTLRSWKKHLFIAR